MKKRGQKPKPGRVSFLCRMPKAARAWLQKEAQKRKKTDKTASMNDVVNDAITAYIESRGEK